MKTGGIAHYPEPYDQPTGRVDAATSTAYLHFASLTSYVDAWIASDSALYLRRLAAAADKLADELDAAKAQTAADLETARADVSRLAVQPADVTLRPTRKPRNQGVPELDEHVWQSYETGQAFDVHPIALEYAHKVKLAAQKSARYLTGKRKVDVRVTVDKITAKDEPGVVRVRIAAHPPKRKGRAVSDARRLDED